MHYNTQIELYIGNYLFSFVNEIVVVSSWKNLTDTITIKLPNNIIYKNRRFRELFNVGDKILLKAGYDDKPLFEVFRGYVTVISPKTPLEIEGEDEAWLLKKNNIVDTMKNTSLNAVLNKHFKDFKYKSLDVILGNLEVNNISSAKLLSEIKSNFGINSFFRNTTLTCGLMYDPETSNNTIVYFNRDVRENNLTYSRANDIKLNVTAISNLSDGTKIEYKTGDVDGEQRTLNFYNLNENDLKTQAEAEIDKLKYSGFRGSLRVFFNQFIKHGDVVALVDNVEEEISDKDGSYYVDQVQYNIGVNGFSQTLEIGPKA